MSGFRIFAKLLGRIVSLGDSSGNWAAVWASVSSLGFGGRFRCPRQWRSSEHLFSKRMEARKDIDTKLGIGTGLFVTVLMVGEVVPPFRNIKAWGMVVVSKCSATRGMQ